MKILKNNYFIHYFNMVDEAIKALAYHDVRQPSFDYLLN